MNIQDNLIKSLHLVIQGHVQGVFFRDSMRQKAQQLNICGWVRNQPDGAVEAVVYGESSAVDAIVQWAHQGPQLASVTRVKIVPDDGHYRDFQIIE